jgi:pimeloyl-ACP methyl ester carboxylesterase
MRNVVILFALLVAFSPRIGAADDAGRGHRGSVVLLHGLVRTSDSMAKMARALEADGYRVCNVSYPSREHTIEVLTADFVIPAVRACQSNDVGAVHFVTHSLGGIIVRQLVKSTPDLKIGRVVMLSPPNHGSDVVDKLGTWGLFGLVNGPAGQQLGTGQDSIPQSLGPASFEVGILTGSRTINPILSLLIPGTDDGKVSIQSAKLEGMKDFCVIPSSHPFIMSNDLAIEQTLAFLASGRFTCAATDAASRSFERIGR